MEAEGLRPSERCYRALIHVFLATNNFQLAMAFFDDLLRSGLRPSVRTLLDIFHRCVNKPELPDGVDTVRAQSYMYIRMARGSITHCCHSKCPGDDCVHEYGDI